MSQSTALTRSQGQASALAMWTPEQIDVIREQVAPGTTDAQLALFAEVCRRTGLDPFRKQIHGMVRHSRDGDQWVKRLVIVTGIGGYRAIAERSGKFGGVRGPEWCGPDGEWRDVWLSSDPPAAARYTVVRTDWAEPVTVTVTYSEFVQTDRNGQPNSQWARMPAHMLGKCAAAAAFRAAFPEDVGDLHDEAEWPDEESERPAAQGPTRAAPMTKSQGDRIINLGQTLGVGWEQVREWPEAGGARRFADLTADQAAAILRRLEQIGAAEGSAAAADPSPAAAGGPAGGEDGGSADEEPGAPATTTTQRRGRRRRAQDSGTGATPAGRATGEGAAPDPADVTDAPEPTPADDAPEEHVDPELVNDPLAEGLFEGARPSAGDYARGA